MITEQQSNNTEKSCGVLVKTKTNIFYSCLARNAQGSIYMLLKKLRAAECVYAKLPHHQKSILYLDIVLVNIHAI